MSKIRFYKGLFFIGVLSSITLSTMQAQYGSSKGYNSIMFQYGSGIDYDFISNLGYETNGKNKGLGFYTDYIYRMGIDHSSGNVGINSPIAHTKLHIRTDVGHSGGHLRLQRKTTNGEVGISLLPAPYSESNRWIVATGAWNKENTFVITQNGQYGKGLWITPNNMHVGIGTSTPTHELHVNGSARIAKTLILDCNDCGSNSSEVGPSNWGKAVIQGRVISTNNNLHLSPPAGYGVIINSNYRGAGGSRDGTPASLHVEGAIETGTKLFFRQGTGGYGEYITNTKHTKQGFRGLSLFSGGSEALQISHSHNFISFAPTVSFKGKDKNTLTQVSINTEYKVPNAALTVVGPTYIGAKEDGIINRELGSLMLDVNGDAYITGDLKVEGEIIDVNSTQIMIKPSTTSDVSGYLDKNLAVISSEGVYSPVISSVSYGAPNSTHNSSAMIVGKHARGTRTSPTASKSGDVFAIIGGHGCYGNNSKDFEASSSIDMASMVSYAGEDWSSEKRGSGMLFCTAKNGEVVSRPRMLIDPNGNVGVGFEDRHVLPTDQFEFCVNGTIGTNSIECTPEKWSDYVFDEDYELMSLNDVEDYINNNRHLPDIPSEKEVKNNGIDLGKMNALLLQKIEELTLYLIQQEKRVNELERRLDIN